MGDDRTLNGLYQTNLLPYSSSPLAQHVRTPTRTRPLHRLEHILRRLALGWPRPNSRRGKSREAFRQPSHIKNGHGEPSHGHGSAMQPPGGPIGAASGGWPAATFSAPRKGLTFKTIRIW